MIRMNRLILALSLLAASVPLLAANGLETLKSYVLSSQADPERDAEVQQLLQADPSLVNARDEDGPILQWTLTHLAAEGEVGRKSRKLAELLVAKGADVNALDTAGNSLLTSFALEARRVQMDFLLKNRADVNARNEETGRTALHTVLFEENQDSERSETRKRETLEVVKLLIKAGGNVNAKDVDGATPLFLPAFFGNLEMTQLLVNSGSSVNARDDAGYSVLGLVLARYEGEWATTREKAVLPPVIEFLKSKGAVDTRPGM